MQTDVLGSPRDEGRPEARALPSVIAHLIAAKDIARFEEARTSHPLVDVIDAALDAAYRHYRLAAD